MSKDKPKPIKDEPNPDRRITLPLPPDTPIGPQDKPDKQEPAQPDNPPADNPPPAEESE